VAAEWDVIEAINTAVKSGGDANRTSDDAEIRLGGHCTYVEHRPERRVSLNPSSHMRIVFAAHQICLILLKWLTFDFHVILEGCVSELAESTGSGTVGVVSTSLCYGSSKLVLR
jgi:hypothetical protein